MTVKLRQAEPSDAPAMIDLINPIIRAGGTTAFTEPFDKTSISQAYLDNPFLISLWLAEEQGQLMGFQSLEWCDPDWPGDGKLPPDWAAIGTFVRQCAHGKGVGRKLFAATLESAKQAKPTAIDATIKTYNTGGLAYYSAMGFQDYRQIDDKISKKYEITP